VETLRKTLAAMAEHVRIPYWHEVLGRVLIGARPQEEPQNFLRALVESAATCGDADTAALTVLVEHGRWLKIAMTAGAIGEWTGRLIPVEGSVSALAIEAGHAVIVGDLALDARTLQAARDVRVGPALLAPVWLGARMVGVISLGRRVGGANFDENDSDMLEGFAEHMGWPALHAGHGQPVVAAGEADTTMAARTAAQLFDITVDLSRIAADVGEDVSRRLLGPIAALAAVIGRMDVRRDREPESAPRGELLSVLLAEAAEHQLAVEVEIPDSLGSAPPDVRVAMVTWIGHGVRVAAHCGIARWVELTVSAGPASTRLELRYQGRLPDDATLARLGARSLAADTAARGDADRTMLIVHEFDTGVGNRQ
jgi:GAF domain